MNPHSNSLFLNLPLLRQRFNKARKYYVLDGFVTDHVALIRDTSTLYRWLSTFEEDEKRKTAMYLRRINELEPVRKQLGRQAYLDTIKQLQFEIGECWMEMCELKQGRLEKKVAANPAYRSKESEILKSNEYCEAAIEAFYETVGGDSDVTFSVTDLNEQLGFGKYKEADIEAGIKALCAARVDGASPPMYKVAEDGKYGLVDT